MQSLQTSPTHVARFRGCYRVTTKVTRHHSPATSPTILSELGKTNYMQPKARQWQQKLRSGGGSLLFVAMDYGRGGRRADEGIDRGEWETRQQTSGGTRTAGANCRTGLQRRCLPSPCRDSAMDKSEQAYTADWSRGGDEGTGNWEAEASSGDLSRWAGCSTSPRWSAAQRTREHDSPAAKSMAARRNPDPAKPRTQSPPLRPERVAATKKTRGIWSRSDEDNKGNPETGQLETDRRDSQFETVTFRVGLAIHRKKRIEEKEAHDTHRTATKLVCQQQTKHVWSLAWLYTQQVRWLEIAELEKENIRSGLAKASRHELKWKRNDYFKI